MRQRSQRRLRYAMRDAQVRANILALLDEAERDGVGDEKFRAAVRELAGNCSNLGIIRNPNQHCEGFSTARKKQKPEVITRVRSPRKDSVAKWKRKRAELRASVERFLKRKVRTTDNLSAARQKGSVSQVNESKAVTQELQLSGSARCQSLVREMSKKEGIFAGGKR